MELVGPNGLEPLRRAIRAAELAGKGVRVMCHIGSAPGNLSDLLDLLRPGDVLTHAYSGAGNNTVQNGQLLPAARAAKQRGVVVDVARATVESGKVIGRVPWGTPRCPRQGQIDSGTRPRLVKGGRSTGETPSRTDGAPSADRSCAWTATGSRRRASVDLRCRGG
jgi:hypothetical protein